MQKPDFSGLWRFNPARSVLQTPPPDATVFIIEHDEPRLHISRTHVAGGTQDTFTIDLMTDGREVRLEHRGAQLSARAFWDDEILAFDTTLVRGGEEGANTVRYALAPDRKSFVAQERFRSRSLNYDNTWVMDKVP